MTLHCDHYDHVTILCNKQSGGVPAVQVKKEPQDPSIKIPRSICNGEVIVIDGDSDEEVIAGASDTEPDSGSALPVQSTKGKVKNGHLPNGIGTDSLWISAFIGTVLRWMGTRERPWIMDDSQLVPVYQAVYNHVFRKKYGPMTIQAKDAIYTRVSCDALLELRTPHTCCL